MKAKNVIAVSVLCIILGTVVGACLMTLVYCIPTKVIEANVKKSAAIIEQEGLYPELTRYATSYLDNWTDSIMLAEAAHPNYGPAYQDAMQVYRYVASEQPDESLVIWAKTGEYVYETSYPQYWHGYLLFLKPLLTVMDLSGIRLLNGIFQTVLTFGIAALLWLNNKKRYILPWIISMAMLMPLAQAKCLQFSSCYYVFALSAVMILLLKNRANLFLVFLWAGIATASFDFLTYPVSTFGIPAVFYLIRYSEDKSKSNLQTLAGYFLVWAAGYGLMWAGKLLAGSLLTGINYLEEANGHVGQWFDGDRWFSVGRVFYLNVRDFIYTPVTLLAFVYAALMGVVLYRNRGFLSALYLRALPFLLLAVFPFLWYLFLFNPSGIHHFFTNKACVVTSFSLLSMLAAFLPEKQLPAGNE